MDVNLIPCQINCPGSGDCGTGEASERVDSRSALQFSAFVRCAEIPPLSPLWRRFGHLKVPGIDISDGFYLIFFRPGVDMDDARTAITDRLVFVNVSARVFCAGRVGWDDLMILLPAVGNTASLVLIDLTSIR